MLSGRCTYGSRPLAGEASVGVRVATKNNELERVDTTGAFSCSVEGLSPVIFEARNS